MRFGSVCSGIEAASVAFTPLGWSAAWFAEIEAFPSAVLAHHYPDVPNLGDMTALPGRVLSGAVEAPDLLCGGTPCQAFSVAGLRASLDDARGNLTLKFVEIADAVDDRRLVTGFPPAIVFWENVPGVLNTKDNAFGCFLAGLAGEDAPLVPPGEKWPNAGAVFGPKRAVAWRVLDAQYFGVAQRRRRVFVIASARNGFDPAKVLFEFDGVRRDTAPSRETRQGIAGGIEIGPGGGRLTDLNPTLDTRAKDGPVRNQLAGAVICMAHGQGGAEVSGERSPTLTCNHEAPIAAYPSTVHTLRGEGFDASEDGTGRGTPLVPVLPFDTTQITSAANRSNPQPVDPCHPLAAGAHAPAIAYALQHAQIGRKDSAGPQGKGWQEEVAFTQDSRSCADAVAIAFPSNLSGTQCASTENLAPSMGALNQTAVAVRTANTSANGHGISKELAHTLDRAQGQAVAFSAQDNGRDVSYDVAPTMRKGGDGGGVQLATVQSMQARRLTPVECERLQGFPDGYTDIPWTEYQRIQRRAEKAGTSFEAELRKHGKVLRGPAIPACPDGPRYKALGNSWAVPCVAWIGRRIQQHLEAA